ncbi:MAG: helix-turn-helix transcriptional regulator, partial [Vulcanimicrobiaceae bacterium]
REEVAERAEISVALYAWLEQARDVPVSRRTSESIAAALRLDDAERAHLLALAFVEDGARSEEISPSLHRMVESLSTHPIFVLDHLWDIVVANPATQAVFGPIVGSVNILEAVFTSESVQARFSNWEVAGQNLLEMFRFDYARFADDPQVTGLVTRLRASSEVFDRLWRLYGVRTHPRSLPAREMRHPAAGRLLLEATTYTVDESPGLRLLMFTPQDEATAARIAQLVARSAMPAK